MKKREKRPEKTLTWALRHCGAMVLWQVMENAEEDAQTHATDDGTQ